MILLTKSPGSSKSFQEAPRKLQKKSGQKSRNNFVGFLEEVLTPKGHFEINWPLGCQKYLLFSKLVVFCFYTHFFNVSIQVYCIFFFKKYFEFFWFLLGTLTQLVPNPGLMLRWSYYIVLKQVFLWLKLLLFCYFQGYIGLVGIHTFFFQVLKI